MNRKVVVLVMIFLVWSLVPIFADTFGDVSKDHWAYTAVVNLTEKGIMAALPGGVFKGENPVTRYEFAVSLVKTLERLESGQLTVAPDDYQTIQELVTEFADEIALVGLKVSDLDDKIQNARQEIDQIKTGGSGSAHCAGGNNYGKIDVTGDIWIHIENQEYENDTIDDDMATFARTGLNFSSMINEKVSAYARIVNEDLVGREFGNDLEDSTLGIHQAYVNVKEFFDLGDIRMGRQFVKVGHSIALDNKLDAVVFNKDIDDFTVKLIAADMPDNTAKNGFNLKGLDVHFSVLDHAAEFYYLVGSTVTNDPINYGFSLDGNLIENIDFLMEYGKSDPATATGVKGDFWLAGANWDMTPKFNVELMFAKGDEEFSRVAGDVYYHNRFKDMFGRIYDGDMGEDGFQSVVPAGRTNATGSLCGIKDVFLKVTSPLDDKNDGCFIYERVSANDTNGDGTGAAEYKRYTLGLDHQYKPNTTYGIRYDTVVFDTLIDQTNAGGWYRVMVDMRMKF